MEKIYTFDELSDDAQARVMYENFCSCFGEYLQMAVSDAVWQCDRSCDSRPIWDTKSELSLYDVARVHGNWSGFLDDLEVQLCAAVRLYDQHNADHICTEDFFYTSDGKQFDASKENENAILASLGVPPATYLACNWHNRSEILKRLAGTYSFERYIYDHQNDAG